MSALSALVLGPGIIRRHTTLYPLCPISYILRKHMAAILPNVTWSAVVALLAVDMATVTFKQRHVLFLEFSCAKLGALLCSDMR